MFTNLWKWAQQKKRLWHHHTQPKAIILLYHRITKIETDPLLLCVSPQNFAEHLKVLKQSYHLLSLSEFAHQLDQGIVTDHSVVITFDDGYADNLYQAKPLLAKYEIPATVFVTTGTLCLKQEFWWDDLERLLLHPGKVPEQMTLHVNGQNYSWELKNSTRYSNSEYQKHRHWNVLQMEIPCSRHQTYLDVWALLRPLQPETRQKLMKELCVWAGKDETGRSTHFSLIPDEVKQLTATHLIEVGAHCVKHPVLSSLPINQQQKEIQESKQQLEDILGYPVTTFSYPYGTHADYTSETVNVVQKTGFSCACSNFSRVVQRGTDCFQLPRNVVRDWSGEEFSKHLQEWFHG